MAFALPLLNKGDKKERYQSIIEKRRRDLFEQAKEQAKNPAGQQATMSARDSMATFFKVQNMFGEMGEKVRDQMLQAGIRNPSAPIKFMIARVVLPLVLMIFAMVILSSSEEEVSNSTTLLILGGAVFAGYKLPWVLVQNQIQKRTEEINLTFPDALDMMLICVQGGIGLEQTVSRIADEMADHSETLAEELGILSAEMAMLNDRRSALQDFARRIGSGAARTFATALIQAEQYGTSVSQAMKVMSEELRDMRMQEAERKAAALPPKLTVPMIAFFLPVLFIVIIGPAVLRAMYS
ncbi:MAG: type II secretion system F family protein [Rhodospirillales bacterium]|nr:type II secretion system F family protein [Rhodospirillales bacterium]MCB9994992.1 type II secretion system F family protein [Rhodospirillales bacterium]